MYTSKQQVIDALNAGEKITLDIAEKVGFVFGDLKYTRGYVTRRPRLKSEIPVCIAGGSRLGELYFLVNCANSTTYCFRQYLI